MAALLCWMATAVVAVAAAAYDDYSVEKMPAYNNDYENPALAPSEDYADRSPDTSSLDYKLDEERVGKDEKVLLSGGADVESWQQSDRKQSRQKASVEDNVDNIDKHRLEESPNKYKSRIATPKIRPRIKNMESEIEVSHVKKKTKQGNQNYEIYDENEPDGIEEDYTLDVRSIEEPDSRYIRKNAYVEKSTHGRWRNRSTEDKNERELDNEQYRKGNGKHIKIAPRKFESKENADYSAQSESRQRKPGHYRSHYESSIASDHGDDDYGDYYDTKRNNVRTNPSLRQRKQKDIDGVPARELKPGRQHRMRKEVRAETTRTPSATSGGAAESSCNSLSPASAVRSLPDVFTEISLDPNVNKELEAFVEVNCANRLNVSLYATLLALIYNLRRYSQCSQWRGAPSGVATPTPARRAVAP